MEVIQLDLNRFQWYCLRRKCHNTQLSPTWERKELLFSFSLWQACIYLWASEYDSMWVLHLLFSWGREELKDTFVRLDVIYKLLFLEKKVRPYYKLQQLKTYFHLKCIQTKTQNSKIKIKRKTINQQIFINMQYLQMTKLAILCLKVTLSSPTETNFITRLS